MGGKEHPAIQFDEGSNVSAGGEDPLKPYRIHSGSIGGVCRLEHDKRRHGIECKLESSAEKSRAVRSGQDKPIANSGIPDVRIAGTARNRVAATRPNLELMAALLGAILGDGERKCNEQREKECQKKRACSPNG